MNSKNIKKALRAKIDNWCAHVEDSRISDIIKKNVIITGGAIVNMLNGEKPNDYDCYFRTGDACYEVAKYYADVWNSSDHESTVLVQFQPDFKDEMRVSCYIKSAGYVVEEDENGIDDETEPVIDEEPYASEDEEDENNAEAKTERPKYRPRYFSTNAITLSDDIQLVIRFFGAVEDIHKNYDFIHTTCSYDYAEDKLELPSRALEAIINKELYYIGSKYPLCSIIRSRKFIQRGWSINAGQYLKMCLQLNELDLKDLNVFKDQLCGVDSLYFSKAIEAIARKKEADPDFKIDNEYLFEVINRIF